jgi:hypothetical protein
LTHFEPNLWGVFSILLDAFFTLNNAFKKRKNMHLFDVFLSIFYFKKKFFGTMLRKFPSVFGGLLAFWGTLKPKNIRLHIVFLGIALNRKKNNFFNNCQVGFQEAILKLTEKFFSL